MTDVHWCLKVGLLAIVDEQLQFTITHVYIVLIFIFNFKFTDHLIQGKSALYIYNKF